MAFNGNWIKLIGILVGGVLVLVVGFIIQRHSIIKKQKELDMMNQAYNKGNNNSDESNQDLSESQKIMRDYILKYKSNYSREQIKSALIDAGNEENEVNEMLSNYFN